MYYWQKRTQPSCSAARKSSWSCPVTSCRHPKPIHCRSLLNCPSCLDMHVQKHSLFAIGKSRKPSYACVLVMRLHVLLLCETLTACGHSFWQPLQASEQQKLRTRNISASSLMPGSEKRPSYMPTTNIFCLEVACCVW